MSSFNWLSLIGAAALGGVISSGITLAFSAGDDSSHEEPIEQEPAEDIPAAHQQERDNSEDLGGDGVALEAKVRKLERRLSLLTASLAQNKPLAEDTTAGATDPADVDVADPVFEAAVLDIMDRETERKEDEREERREQLRATQTERMSSRLGTQLGLDQGQQERIQSVLKEHFEAISSLRQSEDAPVTRREWRERFSELRTQTEEKLSSVFTAEQKAQYDALDPDDQISLGWGGRGRDRAATRRSPPQ